MQCMRNSLNVRDSNCKGESEPRMWRTNALSVLKELFPPRGSSTVRERGGNVPYSYLVLKLRVIKLKCLKRNSSLRLLVYDGI